MEFDFKLGRIFKERNYCLLALATSLFVLIAFPAIQIYFTGGFQNAWVWLSIIPKINLILFVVFSIIFGVLLSFQVYTFKKTECNIKDKAKGVSSGGIATLLGLLVPACPACVSFAAFLLPAAGTLGFLQVMLEYSGWILVLSISLMLFGIYSLDGFKKEN